KKLVVVGSPPGDVRQDCEEDRRVETRGQHAVGGLHRFEHAGGRHEYVLAGAEGRGGGGRGGNHGGVGGGRGGFLAGMEGGGGGRGQVAHDNRPDFERMSREDLYQAMIAATQHVRPSWYFCRDGDLQTAPM
ncbi:MAG: hypothetical protein ACK55I_14955, partial [bacterium]